MAKEREVDLGRLCRVMQAHRLALKVYRENLTEAVRKYAGTHWSDNASPKKIPVNLLSKYIEIVAPKLVSKNPRFNLTTFRKSARPAVDAMQTWMNRESKRMYLCETLQRAVTDGLFSVGFVKVALAAPADAANGSWAYQAGKPFACRVSLDDMVFDMRAKDFRECSYIGHRIRVPLAAVQEDDNYSKFRKGLKPSTESMYNVGGDERIHKIGEGYVGTSEDFEDMVDLWEIYLPRHRLVVTLMDDGESPVTVGQKFNLDGALRVQKWIGPECGPYHVFKYGLVPGNLMPKGRLMDLIDTADAVNATYRKLVHQAGRQKEVLGVGQGAVEDGRRIVKADDGDVIQVNNPESMKQFQFGGPNQQNMGFGIHMKDLFSWIGGNLDTIGGLSTQAKTARQEAQLGQNSSASISDLTEATVSAVSSVGEALAWYWYHDPVLVMQSQHTLPNMQEFSVNRAVTPQDRQQIPFDELDLKVDPYSLVHKSPDQKIAALTDLMTKIIMPLSQVLAPQGITPDMNAFLNKFAVYNDLPEVLELVTVNEPMMDSATGGGQQPQMMPGSTQRNYTRENIPAGGQDPGMAMVEAGENEAA